MLWQQPLHPLERITSRLDYAIPLAISHCFRRSRQAGTTIAWDRWKNYENVPRRLRRTRNLHFQGVTCGTAVPNAGRREVLAFGEAVVGRLRRKEQSPHPPEAMKGGARLGPVVPSTSVIWLSWELSVTLSKRLMPLRAASWFALIVLWKSCCTVQAATYFTAEGSVVKFRLDSLEHGSAANHPEH